MIRRFILLGLLMALMAPLPASAQDQGAAGQIEQSSQTTPEEKIRFTDMALEEMRSSVKETAKMLENAERANNPGAIQCLSKKITTMRALLEVSEASAVTLKQALADGEYETSEHEYRKIAIALSKVRQFRAEADACAGGGAAQPGTTSVEVIESAISQDDDTDELDLDLDAFGDQPPDTSQFQ